MPADIQTKRRKSGAMYDVNEYDAPLLKLIDKHKLTTTQIAKHCRVVPRAVRSWTLATWEKDYSRISDSCFELLLLKLGEDPSKYFKEDG